MRRGKALVKSLHLKIRTVIRAMKPGRSTSPACAAEAASARRRPGFDFACASRNHRLPRAAAERAPAEGGSWKEFQPADWSSPGLNLSLHPRSGTTEWSAPETGAHGSRSCELGLTAGPGSFRTKP